MADDAAIGDPGGSGFQLPDAPGDFSESVPPPPEKPPAGPTGATRTNPFTPLTPAQERDERARLNFEAGFRKTLLGSTQAADAARISTGFTPDQKANFQDELQTAMGGVPSELPAAPESTPDFDAIQNEAKDKLEKMRTDQQAYENMPGYKNILEGAYSLAGAFGGAMASPEGAIFPELKVTSAAWTAAHPLISQMIGYGLGQAALQGFSNPIVQTNEIKAGFRKEYDVVEADMAFPMGFLGGAIMPAIAKGGAALYRYTSDAIERWALKGIVHGPTLTPEIKPPIAPETPRAPADTFDIGSTQQAKMPTPVAAGITTPQEGMTRLYRAAGAGDETAKHILFTAEPFPGATEFIDVPEGVAAQMVHGDRVSLPAELAGARKPIPPGEPGVQPVRPDAYDLDQKAAEIATREPGPAPVARNEVEQKALDIADQLHATSPEAANFAAGIRGAVKGGNLRPENIPFYEERLASFRAQAGSAADKPSETGRTLAGMLDKKHQKQLEESGSWPTEVRSAIADAHESFTEAIKTINDHGLKFGEVNASHAQTKPLAREAEKQAMSLGGQMARLLNGIKRAKGDFNSPRVQKDLAGLRETIAEGRRAPKAPAAAKEKPPQTFSEWVQSMGGLKGAEQEIKDLDLPSKILRPKGKRAMTAERVLEAAVQQKRLPEGSTLNDVYGILRDESTGAAKHYHPGELSKVKEPDAEMLRAEGEVDASLHEIEMHPSQTTSRKAKAERNAVREDAINDVYRNGTDPERAIEDAVARQGEHGRAESGHPPFDDGVDIPFDPDTAPSPGGQAGRDGARGAGGEPPADGGTSPPSASEAGISKRVKGMAGEGPGVLPGQTRPGAGVASANIHAATTPLENLQQMMRRISAQLQFVVRKGVHERGALGTYNFKTEIARIGDLGPDGVATWAHELGHHVENTMMVTHQPTGAIVENPIGKLAHDNFQSMKAFAGVMGEGLEPAQLEREGFAKFMEGYITNREGLQVKDPIFIKKFRELMARDNPELLAVLDDANLSFERYNAASSGRAVDSIVVSHGEIPPISQNDPLQRSPVRQWLSEQYFRYVNKQHPISLLVRYGAQEFEKKYGKLLDLRPDEDPRVLMQVLSDAGFQKTVMDLTYGISSMHDLVPSGPSYFSIIRRVTADPLTGQEVRTPAEYLARLKSWDGYKIARWHLSLRRQMSNGEIDLIRMPTGLTDGDAVVKIAEAEKLHPDWPALAEEEYAFQKNMAKLEQQNGLRSAESYADIMHERNHEYVPLYRDMRAINESLGVGGSYRADRALEDLGQFERTGSSRNILSPTESTMRRLAEINDMANQNMVVRAIRDFANRVGGKEGAFIAEHIPNAELRALDVNVQQAVIKAATAAGWMEEDAKSLARNLQQEIGADLRTRLYRTEAIKAGNKPIVFGWDNGERYAMRLPDGMFGRQLVEQMDSMGPKGMATWAQAGGLVMDALTFSSSTLRAGATGTPTFMAKNLLRDAFMQFLLVPEAGVQTLVGGNAIRGIASYVSGDEAFRMYTSLGGIKGGIGAAGLSRSSQQVEFERQIMRFKDPALGISKSKFSPTTLQAERSKIAEALGEAGVEPHKQVWFGNIKELMQSMEISETAGRVGLFKAVYDSNIAMGRDRRYAMFDAAQKARDFIDYGRIGSRMEMWSRTVPFLNANVQGVDKFIRTYAGTPTSPGIFFRPFTQQQAEYQQALRTALIPRVAALASISAGIAYVFQDDPVYQRLSVQQRSQNWIFRLPFLKSGKYDLLNGDVAELPEGMQGAWIFIPKPWEPGSIFNLAERAVEFVHSGDTDQIAKALSSMRYSFNMPNPLELPLIRTSSGLASNYDTFFQRPIVPDSMKGLAPHLQANEYTNKFYVALAQGLNMVWNSEDAHTWFKNNIPIVGAMMAAPWSPMEAQYLMQGAFGDWPRELGGIGGIGRSLFNGVSGSDFNFQLNDVPALRAFVKDKMAMGEPMNELYNQIGQNGGRLTVANKTFSQLVKNGDLSAATQYFNTLDDSQRDYVRAHQVQAGPLMNVLSPLDRTSALASVTRTLKNGLLMEGGLPTFRDPNVRIKLEAGKRDTLIQAINEYTATEARNGLIVQGANGYKYLPLVNTQPYLDTINKISPEVGRELSGQLARAKVMPIETIQRFWPDAQKLLRAGDSVRPTQLSAQLKSLSERAAASQGYEGGGRRAGRGAVDSSGFTVKKGKTAPTSLPAEAQ